MLQIHFDESHKKNPKQIKHKTKHINFFFLKSTQQISMATH